MVTEKICEINLVECKYSLMFAFYLKQTTMARSTKTWKIGEYATGGVITVNITGKVIEIQNREWDFSKGSRRSSDQSNAGIMDTATIVNDPQDNVYRKVYEYLTKITTHYYAEQVIKWIEGKVGKLNTGLNW